MKNMDKLDKKISSVPMEYSDEGSDVSEDEFFGVRFNGIDFLTVVQS